MAIDQKAARPPANEGHARWRDAHEIQALRDTIRVYRSGATALAADVTELRAEVQRLRAELRVGRLLRDSRQIEVEIDLDEHAQTLSAPSCSRSGAIFRQRSWRTSCWSHAS